VYDPGTGDRTYIATYTYAPVPGTYDVMFSAYDSGGGCTSVTLRVVLLGYPVISFVGEGTESMSEIVVTNGADNGCFGYDDYYARASEPVHPVRGGYVFTGWYLDEGCTVPYGWDSLVREDTVLYAGWEPDPDSVRIVFRGSDGTVYSDSYYQIGDTIHAPESPVIPSTDTEEFTFAGWAGFTEGMIAEADAEFVAIIVSGERLYTVTYYVEGKPFVVQKYPYGASIVFPEEVPSKDGYVFAGWKNRSQDMVVTEDRGFCAILESEGDSVFAVSYVVDGNVSVSYVPVGSVLALDTPSRAGYRFTGWFSDEGCTIPVDISSITADCTVYAGFDREETGQQSAPDIDIIPILGAVVIIMGCLASATGARRNTVMVVGGIVAVIAGGCMVSSSGVFL